MLKVSGNPLLEGLSNPSIASNPLGINIGLLGKFKAPSSDSVTNVYKGIFIL